ncbi:MAG: hypothetical protein OQK50_01620 [Deltaproteobacteria bacterium]|jgi:hypothetical protein|nr:hypothetical protein [Deltaproteobacteria bacterium]MCW9049013.1 hypothetical protein [Deltaproteobacteria bacterium]
MAKQFWATDPQAGLLDYRARQAQKNRRLISDRYDFLTTLNMGLDFQ